MTSMEAAEGGKPETVELATKQGMKPVQGYVRGHFAVTPYLVQGWVEDVVGKAGWVITHVPTGRMFSSVAHNDPATALEVIDAVNALPFDFGALSTANARTKQFKGMREALINIPNLFDRSET